MYLIFDINCENIQVAFEQKWSYLENLLWVCLNLHPHVYILGKWFGISEIEAMWATPRIYSKANRDNLPLPYLCKWVIHNFSILLAITIKFTSKFMVWNLKYMCLFTGLCRRNMQSSLCWERLLPPLLLRRIGFIQAIRSKFVSTHVACKNIAPKLILIFLFQNMNLSLHTTFYLGTYFIHIINCKLF